MPVHAPGDCCERTSRLVRLLSGLGRQDSIAELFDAVSVELQLLYSFSDLLLMVFDGCSEGQWYGPTAEPLHANLACTAAQRQELVTNGNVIALPLTIGDQCLGVLVAPQRKPPGSDASLWPFLQ